MPRRSKKRKLDEVDEWERSAFLPEDVLDEMESMWEIPQIFHFLHLIKETHNIPSLSMYEVERMLLMPKASKQLAQIMTSLLSAPAIKSQLCNIPPMPYDFWTNVLMHKIEYWFKFYESKHRDPSKTLEAIGVEPGFWRVFSNYSTNDKNDYSDLSFKQKVWLLKTVCDTVMHSRKSVQDDIANQPWEDRFESVLGIDEDGARYLYFPQFLDTDLRIYKQTLDNKILQTVKPTKEEPKVVMKLRKVDESKAPTAKRRRKKSRWKYGSLPQKKAKCRKEILTEYQIEETSISPCSNNNHIDLEAIDKCTTTRSSSSNNGNNKFNEDVSNASTSVSDNSTSKVKCENNSEDKTGCCSRTDDEKLNDKISSENSSKSDDEKLSETRGDNNEVDEAPQVNNNKDSLTDWISALNSNENCSSINNCNDKSDEPLLDTDSDSSESSSIKNQILDEDSDYQYYSDEEARTQAEKVAKQEEVEDFRELLDELSVSKFQLVANGVESLRELIDSFSFDDDEPLFNRDQNELRLIQRLKGLLVTLKDKEEALNVSLTRARANIRKEWTCYTDGIVEEKSDSNYWVLGNQGCALNSTASEDSTTVKSIKEESNVSPQANKEAKEEGKDSSDEEEPKSCPRVLRTRGVSSYIEQFSSDESLTEQLDGWPDLEAVYAPLGNEGSSPLKGGMNDDNQSSSEDSDTDQEWIMPSMKKKKSKKQSPSKRLKSLQCKLQNLEDKVEATSISLEATRRDDNTPIIVPEASQPPSNDPLTPNNASSILKTILDPPADLTSPAVPSSNNPICKIESISSVHSELDIKDEGPIFDNEAAAALQQNCQMPQQQQNYMLLNQAPMNYYVMQQNPPLMAQPHQYQQSAYYVQQPPSYIVQNPTNYGMTTAQPAAMNQPYVQYVMGPTQQQQHQPLQLLQPTTIPQQPHIPPNYSVPVGVHNNVVGPRQPAAYAPRMRSYRPAVRTALRPQLRPKMVPNGAVIRSYPPVRGGASVRGRGNVLRLPAGPRQPVPQQVRGVQRKVASVRRPLSKQPLVAAKPKDPNTTSLIVLSDDDDEIEMIIPKDDQRKATTTPSKTKPIVTSNVPITPKCSLPAQIVQRMNQGGISITPIKPPPQPTVTQVNSNTQLVVVVNETGSHYALALPNGSKLILTPEQLAQIRASNGGKLIL